MSIEVPSSIVASAKSETNSPPGPEARLYLTGSTLLVCVAIVVHCYSPLQCSVGGRGLHSKSSRSSPQDVTGTRESTCANLMPAMSTRFREGSSKEQVAVTPAGKTPMHTQLMHGPTLTSAGLESPVGDPGVAHWLQSNQFQTLQKEKVLTFDTDRFPLRESVVAMIVGVEPRVAERSLSQLHYALDPNFLPQKSFKQSKKKINGKLYCSATGRQLRETFERFVCRFLAPHINDILPCDRLIFQASPCLRISPPNPKRIGRPHCDSMYHHQRGQINFWVPLTRVYDSNTLWAESAAGKADFRPFELEYGEVVRFYGNQCMHHTLPNDTPDTRVSLDIRVVPGPCFDPRAPESMGPDGLPIFTVGGYYGEARRDEGSGEWKVVPGSVVHRHEVLGA